MVKEEGGGPLDNGCGAKGKSEEGERREEEGWSICRVRGRGREEEQREMVHRFFAVGGEQDKGGGEGSIRTSNKIVELTLRWVTIEG